jgi:probable H4MPT-linked C1 transfer pathway protein
MGDWVALDIGGANIKLADGLGFAQSFAFPLWKRPKQLGSELARILDHAPADHVAVTMTGELADCFPSKAEGVRSILLAVKAAAGGRRTRVYLSSGQWVTTDAAIARWRWAAASNWHALARFCGRFAPNGYGLLIDVGSTTTDLIPLRDGRPANAGRTDTERLASGELVYTGVERSPLCALLSSANYRGRRCRIAQELFATTRDAYLVLGESAEDSDDLTTADGRPATIEDARRRLGRMLCADAGEFGPADAESLAREVAQAQLKMLHEAAQEVMARLTHPIATITISGHGQHLARPLVDRLGVDAEVIRLSGRLGPNVSRCAPAHALAVLARESE